LHSDLPTKHTWDRAVHDADTLYQQFDRACILLVVWCNERRALY